MSKIYIYRDGKNFDIPKYTSMSYEQFVNLSDNTIESVYILDMLDYFNIDDASDFLQCVSNKLIAGGELIVQGPDFYQLLISINFNKIQSELGKQVIYNGRIIMDSMDDILEIVTPKGFECYIKKYINIFEYYIEFKKI